MTPRISQACRASMAFVVITLAFGAAELITNSVCPVEGQIGVCRESCEKCAAMAAAAGQPYHPCMKCKAPMDRLMRQWIEDINRKYSSPDPTWLQIRRDAALGPCISNAVDSMLKGTMLIECEERGGGVTYNPPKSINFPNDAVRNGGSGMVMAVLVTEACGGSFLDGMAIANATYGNPDPDLRGAGIRWPKGSDYSKFKDLPLENGKYVGKYVTWDPKTGVVSLKSTGEPLQRKGELMVFKQ